MKMSMSQSRQKSMKTACMKKNPNHEGNATPQRVHESREHQRRKVAPDELVQIP
jgi:hypothetical protein